MSQKNQKPTELPNRVSLSHALRETGLRPIRIIRGCSEAWIDLTPAEESYQWLGRGLTAHPRDPLMPLTGVLKLTEDSQYAIASRANNPSRRIGLGLVRDLAVETETGIMVICDLSKGTCPPIPTPKILVPKQELDNLLSQKIKAEEDQANLEINRTPAREKSADRGIGPQKIHTKFIHQLIEEGETDAHQAWIKFIAVRNEEEGGEIDGERYWVTLSHGVAEVKVTTDGSGEYQLLKDTYRNLFNRKMNKRLTSTD